MPKAAAATFDDDFGAFAPRRGANPRKPAAASRTGTAKARKGKKGKRFGLDMAKVARVAAIGAGASVAAAIMVNALVMQKSRHPAPLFGQTITMPKQAAPKQAAAAVPARPAPPAATIAVPPAPPPQSVTQPATPPMTAKPHHAATAPDKPVGDDAIARLLAGGGKAAKPDAKPDAKPATRTGVRTEGKADAAASGKAVMGVQRALAKLGFPVKPSGTFGPQTRKAIEAFEKDRHLAVKGEMNPRLVKVLSAESGVKVD